MNVRRRAAPGGPIGLLIARGTLAFLGLSLALLAAPAMASAQAPAPERVVIRTRGGDEHVFRVEIANDIYAIMRGLTLRPELPQDGGMLFVFPDRAERSFWMRNTLIPLDVLFLGDDGRIEHIHHDAVPNDPSSIPSTVPVSRVLEINGGRARELGIAVGDVVVNATWFTPGGAGERPARDPASAR